MHSVPMQGGMPMAMPQTMYMAPGQQPMYMPGPVYGMPPGATLPPSLRRVLPVALTEITASPFHGGVSLC